MDLNQVMRELDELFTQERIEEIPEFLESHIALADAEGAQDILLTLYNECIGFYRETGQYGLSIENCHKAMALMEEMGLQDTLPYATTLLNAATAHRAAGFLKESLELYNRVRPVYVALLDEDDIYFAGLYNNLSLLYQEMGDFAAAKEQLENALYIVNHKPDKQFETAVTQANLANTCIELGQDDEAKARAEEAIRIFEEIGVDDAHYSAALSALGSLYYMDKDYLNALEYMEKSRECVAKYLGEDNTQCQRLDANIGIIKEKMNGQKQEISYGEETPYGEKAPYEEEPAYEDESERKEQITQEEISRDEVSHKEEITHEEAPSYEGDGIKEKEEVSHKEEHSCEEEPACEGDEGEEKKEVPPEEEPVYEEESEVREAVSQEEELSYEEAPSYEEGEKEEVSHKEDRSCEEASAYGEEEPEGKEEVPQGENPAYEEEEPEGRGEASCEEDQNPDGTMAEAAMAEAATAENAAAEDIGMENIDEDIDVGDIAAEAVEIEDIMPDLPEDVPEDLQDLEEEEAVPALQGLELCRRYYEEYGRPMIADRFQAYERRIAAGLVGKGSDCFGFDDIHSRDHDFGPRFFLWVTRSVYDEIGRELQAAYEELPSSFMGIVRTEALHGRDRAGVMVIEDFYKNVLGSDLIGGLSANSADGGPGRETLGTVKTWLAVHDYALAAAVNGEVFRDDEGIFTRYRNRLLEYYPRPVWYRKIAQACALFAQNGQYNLPRMRKRGQRVAAELAKAECARQAMKLYYLLNRRYAPHDKWLFKGMPENPAMTIQGSGGKEGVPGLVGRISLLPADKAHGTELAAAVESLAVIFANELEKQNIIGKCGLYLDDCTAELTAKSDALLAATVSDMPVVTALSLSIAKAEFEAFDKVKNEGGRAGCQNNWPTFKVMRMSQYMTWTEDMLLQYLYEFKSNYADGRNMIEEKYARMMESTAPDEYALFAGRLLPLSEEKRDIIEQIISLQVKWMEEFAAQYPNLADNARLIHTAEDLPYDTSYETYLRGELGTYSDRMLDMYGRYIVTHARSGRNVAREIMENTIRFYGYKDLKSANEKENR